jgi:hypothetical protein
MKRSFRNDLLFGATVLLALAAHPGLATAGTETHGGGGFAAHFTRIGKNSVEALRMYCVTAQDTDCHQFVDLMEDAVRKTKVVATPFVFGPDGLPRDATNNGVDVISLNSSNWLVSAQFDNAYEHIARLVIHEYFAIAKLEKSDSFDLSSAIVKGLDDVGVPAEELVGKLPLLSKSRRWADAVFYGDNLRECIVAKLALSELSSDQVQLFAECRYSRVKSEYVLRTQVVVTAGGKGSWMSLAPRFEPIYGPLSLSSAKLQVLLKSMSNDEVVFKSEIESMFLSADKLIPAVAFPARK